MAKESYKNTGRLTRLIIRRDRIRIPIWVLSIVLLNLVTAYAFQDLYKTNIELQAIAQTMLNPAMTAMLGPLYGVENLTLGAMFAHEMLMFTAIACGIMSILLLNRHTRADEEEGRIELILSLPTGRLANITSAIIVLLGVNVLLFVLTGLGLVGLGVESIDLEGSLLYGAAIGVTGIFFTALTAVFSQVSNNTRGTMGLSFTVMIILYLVRAVGDVSSETLSMFSPLGWISRTEVFVQNDWWPIWSTLGISLVLFIVSIYLNTLRDLGAGFLPQRPGRTNASKLLLSPIGHALRIQRTGLISWAVGMFILGASYGAILGDFESFVEEIDIIQELLPQAAGFSLMDQFITMLMVIMAMFATVPALIALFKLRGEEKKNRTESLLSKAVSRYKLLGSYFLISVVNAFIMLTLVSLGLWIAGNPVVDGGLEFGAIYKVALVQIPAMAIMLGIGVFFIGVKPNLTSITWMYLTFSFLILYLGDLLQLPEWIINISPFSHIPQIPMEEMNYFTITILMIISILFIVLGFIGYRKRDIEG
jgi:ABC-2 type transport system permease protein